MTAAVAFDFEDVLPTVQRAHSRASRDDAEDAIQVAVAEGLEKGWPLTAPNVVQRARSRLINALERRDARHLSLDALAEETEESPPVELAVSNVDYGAHAILASPVAAARREAIEAGCPSPRGWTPETILVALRYFARVHGRTPAYRDLAPDPDLPHFNTVKRYYGTLNAALRAAGLSSRPKLTREEWTATEARTALRRYVAEHGRLPTPEDLRNATDIGLPAQMVFYRLFGSVSRRRLAEVAYGEEVAGVLAAVEALRAPGPGANLDLAARLMEMIDDG